MQHSNDDIPRITLTINHSRPTQDIPTTLPYRVFVTLSREPDSHNEPCIIKWDALRDGLIARRFSLFHETNRGLEEIDIEPSSNTRTDRSAEEMAPIEITTNNQVRYHLHELQPSGSISFRATLPGHYQSCLVPGQKYSLKWAGSDINYWTWGSLADKQGTHLEHRNPITIPPSEGISFTATQEAEPWPERAEVEAKHGFNTANSLEWKWRCDEAAKRRDLAAATAPSDSQPSDNPEITTILKMELEPPTTQTLGKQIKIIGRVSLKDTSPDAKPITFHTRRVDGGFRLFRRRQNNSTWEVCPRDDSTGFIIVDNPDVRVNVSEHDAFVSIKPGETSTFEYTPSDADLPKDSAPGDMFRVRYAGVELDWWDWGSADDHANTEVSLPCFIDGDVVEPRDNGGRPRSQISSSNNVDFLVQ